MDFERRGIPRQLLAAMGGVPVAVALEVPWPYFTTQVISSRRDVDYTLWILCAILTTSFDYKYRDLTY